MERIAQRWLRKPRSPKIRKTIAIPSSFFSASLLHLPSKKLPANRQKSVRRKLLGALFFDAAVGGLLRRTQPLNRFPFGAIHQPHVLDFFLYWRAFVPCALSGVFHKAITHFLKSAPRRPGNPRAPRCVRSIKEGVLPVSYTHLTLPTN